MANSIHDELLTIPGIAGAELEGATDQPLGVRVQLAVGADVDLVGREVQRVLASHGMRSQLTRDDESILPPGSVVNLTDYETGAADQVRTPLVSTEPEPLAAVEADDDDDDVLQPVVVAPEAGEVVDEAVAAAVDEPPAPASAPAAVAAIVGVGVDEGADRVVVTVRSTTGDAAARAAPSTPAGLDEASAMAAADLASPELAPRIVAITDATIDGSAVINVVFEIGGGERVAGASVIRGGRASAVARAAWAAMTGSAS